MNTYEVESLMEQIMSRVELLYKIYFAFPFIVVLCLIMIAYKTSETAKYARATNEYVKNILITKLQQPNNNEK